MEREGYLTPRAGTVFQSGAETADEPVSEYRTVPTDGKTAEFLSGAYAQIGVTTGYDPAYRKLGFPNGDVPLETGVCSDVVVRTFRKAGTDLQAEINADMTTHFS
ncbi:MAG: uncharacterized protein QG650_418, partial [Patescibacteria group bacterium]|nr:uncharacterized protein [Patescibacteria group bacterium]